MRVLLATAVLASVTAGSAFAALDLGSPGTLVLDLGTPGLGEHLAAMAAAPFPSLPSTRQCVEVPTAPPTSACAGAQRFDDGPPCEGAGAAEYAFHEVVADVAVNDHRAGVFLYCADFPEASGPGTEVYYAAALAGPFGEAATPGPTIFWYEQGGVTDAGADPYYFCYIEVYLEPLGLVDTLPCIAGPPPHPPGLPA